MFAFFSRYTLVLAMLVTLAPISRSEELPPAPAVTNPSPVEATQAGEDTANSADDEPKAVDPLAEAIEKVRRARLMGGYPDGGFHADGRLTRAQLASILNKTFDFSKRNLPAEQAGQTLEMPVDVPHSHWAYNDIQTALRYGVMQGYRERHFHPDHPVSRAEALAIFAQAYGVYQYNDATVDDILADYPDAGQVPDWARKAMATALRHGFVNAQPGEQIRPLQPMTRGDMAYALSEYLNRLYESEWPVSAE